MAARDVVVESRDAVVAPILHRDAAVCLTASLARASDPDAAVPRMAVEAWKTLDRLAPSRKDAQPAGLNEVRAVLEDRDPLAARGKPATASSQYPGTPSATGATNGQIESSYGAHTNVEREPWIQVDLEKPYAVSEVRVYKRGDAYMDEGQPLVLEFSLDASTW